MEIRDATPSDWSAIWPFFHAIVAAGETYAYDRDLGSAAAREVWMERPPGHTVVAVDEDGTVLGSAKMGPNHGGPASHIGTASFMVDPAAQGRGVGRALGEHVLERCRADGYRLMKFNAVVETNERAVALWRALGFELLGTLPGGFEHPVHGPVGLHQMWRPL